MKNASTIERDSFVFYRSFYASIENIPEEEQLRMFRAVIRYGLDREPPSFQGSQYAPFLTAIWEGIRPQLDANYQRFLNGSRGGCPKGTTKPTMKGNQNAKKQNQNKTKTKPNVNVNENVNENVNDNPSLNLPYNSKEFINTWSELRNQPKWEHKTASALSKSLEQLARFPEQFAIELMDQAIANNYQGVVFPSTQKDYETWKRTHRNSERTPGKVITNIDEILND